MRLLFNCSTASNKEQQPQRRRAGGFTLVELLVVIGIIAVLMGMLMPALNRTRRHAVQLQCASNLRQVGQAILQYANDHKGAVIPTIVWNGNNDDAWAFLLVQGNYLPSWAM